MHVIALIRPGLIRWLLVGGLVLSVACEATPPEPEAGPVEAGGEDSRVPTRDAGPVCGTGCDGADMCCDVGGEAMCVDTDIDPLNCGECGIDCVGDNRGTECQAGFCVCGRVGMGCLGDMRSFCCPPLNPGGVRYCANLNSANDNCGECGRVCDPVMSDHCDGGRCICGDLRGACEGGPSSVCCDRGAGAHGCVDTLTDRAHCGACGNRCQGLERCEAGVCTRGEACPETCDEREICCGGACCTRRVCVGDVCGGGVDDDAGVTTDGGEPADASSEPDVPDSAVADGGVRDAGL